MKFNELYHQILSEAGLIDTIRSKNYERLANRSFKKAEDALEKTRDYDWTDPEREKHEKEFSKQMTIKRQREKKAEELKK